MDVKRPDEHRVDLLSLGAGASLKSMTKYGDFKIRPLVSQDIEALKTFTDQWIGKDYYDAKELEEILEASHFKETFASFGAWSLTSNDLVAARLTLAPNKWSKIIQRGLSPKTWPCPLEEMAYFKSLFVAEGFQGKGLGRTLSEASLEELRKMGAKAVLCHSWLESPGNSSQRYLLGMNFKEVARHEKFWFPIDYECTRCAPERCICTAAEMVLELDS